MKSLLHFIVHLTASLTRIPLTDRLHRATAGLSPESRGGKPGLVKAASSRRTPNFRRQIETTVGLSPESANYSVRYSPEIRAWFQRKNTRSGKRVIALKALANKLSKACFFMLRDGKDFDVKRLVG